MRHMIDVSPEYSNSGVACLIHVCTLSMQFSALDFELLTFVWRCKINYVNSFQI